MTIQDDSVRTVRKRFYDDFAFWAKHACFIRTKEGEITSLVLNRVQRRFVDVVVRQLRTKGRARFIVLKARQQGLSTVIHAILYWWNSQHDAQKCVVVAHKADSTRALFDMYRRTHQHVPDALRPSTQYSSRKEIVFDVLNTGIIIATAGGDAIARGETINTAHLSELAFWPKSTTKENLNGLLQSIPNSAGSMVFVESTANGFNEFHKMYEEAVEGESGYEVFFSPWFETDEYREPVYDGFERTIEEEELVKLYGLDDEQLVWRRRKIAQNGRELFMQEYPATPDEAFIASGRPVFDPVHIVPLFEAAPQPIARMAVEDGVLRPHSVGELFVYQELDPKQTYTIGADVGMGVRNGDPSVAQVLDGEKRQVAVWRGLIQPDAFADTLKAIGLYYNTALIAPERNNHGLLTCVRLWKDLRYPNVFLDVSEGQIADKDSLNVGFLTTEKTKPLIIDRLRAAVRDGAITLHDRTTLSEMRTFVVTQSGKMEAEEGKHDDTVMALAVANHCHVRSFKPIPVSDDFYSQAI